MSRPEWLGPPPVGALAELSLMRGHLLAAAAYASLGLMPPREYLERISEHLGALIVLVALELGVPRPPK